MPQLQLGFGSGMARPHTSLAAQTARVPHGGSLCQGWRSEELPNSVAQWGCSVADLLHFVVDLDV